MTKEVTDPCSPQLLVWSLVSPVHSRNEYIFSVEFVFQIANTDNLTAINRSEMPLEPSNTKHNVLFGRFDELHLFCIKMTRQLLDPVPSKTKCCADKRWNDAGNIDCIGDQMLVTSSYRGAAGERCKYSSAPTIEISAQLKI